MRLRRYHHRIWMPENINSMLDEFLFQLPQIDLTTHASEEFLRDKRGVIPLPSKEELTQPDNLLVEAYKHESKDVLQKAVIRTKNLNTTYDYTYVVAREGFVVSAWANSKNDTHRVVKGFNKFWMPAELKESIRAKLIAEEATYVKMDTL